MKFLRSIMDKNSIIGFAVGLALGCFVFSRLQNNGRLSTPGVFFLGIQIKFKSIACKEDFKALFSPFAAWVKNSEPNTLSYELSESDKDDCIIFLTERYKTKDDYLKVHRVSPQFLEFKEKMMRISENFEMTGHSYVEAGYGYV